MIIGSVYGVCCPVNFSTECTEFSRLRKMESATLRTAVSYTHLDVYKRQEKTLMWFCRPHGTHCLNENQIFIQGTRDHNTFRFYAEQTYDECVARVDVYKRQTRG